MTEAQRPTFVYYGHSTVRCDLPTGERVLIDPWVAGNPACPESLHEQERIDAMLITHAHGDHMGDAVELAKKYRPQSVVACFEICQWLETQGVENTAPMNLGGTQEVLGHKVTMVRADHSSGFLHGDTVCDGGAPAGYVVRAPNGYTFYHAGDTAFYSDMRFIAEFYRPELAFLPIGDLFTMDPRQAAWACRVLEVRRAVPIHWGTFPVLTGTPDHFEADLADLGVSCEVIKLDPGEAY